MIMGTYQGMEICLPLKLRSRCAEMLPKWRYIRFSVGLCQAEVRRWQIVAALVSSSFHLHDDVIKWKHFLRYWPFVRGIHQSPVNSPHKGQWLWALMFSLICVWINGWVNNGEAGDLRRYRAYYDVPVMVCMDYKSDTRDAGDEPWECLVQAGFSIRYCVILIFHFYNFQVYRRVIALNS